MQLIADFCLKQVLSILTNFLTALLIATPDSKQLSFSRSNVYNIVNSFRDYGMSTIDVHMVMLSLTLTSVMTNNMLELFFEDFEISLSFLKWTVLALAFFHFTMLKEKN